MKVVSCRCGRTLSIQNSDGSITLRYKRREVNYWPPARVRCENCGFTKTVDKDVEAVVPSQ